MPRITRGATPLLGALATGQVKAAKVLIAHGAGMVDVKRHAATVIDGMAYHRMRAPQLHEILRDNLRVGMASTEANDISARPEKSQVEWVELLLANGADPNERDEDGNTALQAAILHGDDELARLFLVHGVDVNAKNHGNLTALHCAAIGGRGGIVFLLLTKGADVNASDNHGDTPLHNAALRGYGEVVKVLLNHSANPGVKNSRGRTPLDEAVRRGHKEIVQLLTAKTAGAGANAQSGPGKE